MKGEISIKQILEQHPNLWKAGELSSMTTQTISTGYDALDDIMPGHGWPPNQLMELILPTWGVGELRLLTPLLRQMSQQGYWIVWLAPPHIPYAPYLIREGIELSRVVVIPDHVSAKECLWAMEKLLRAKSCGVVLSWPQAVSHNAMRRLQLAAETGQSIGVMFRLHETKTSAAALRLRLQASVNGLHVEVIKARGGIKKQEAEVRW